MKKHEKVIFYGAIIGIVINIGFVFYRMNTETYVNDLRYERMQKDITVLQKQLNDAQATIKEYRNESK